jgi:3-hydroxyisobutyrate dehydrogenase-like beta-hydroxyacid dehydrogenase
MNKPVRVGVIGLGEAGALIADGLHAAGADVVGYDLKAPPNLSVPIAPTLVDVVAGADVIISITSSSAARKVAAEVATIIEPSTIFADLATGTPLLKEALAGFFPDGEFVDVAVMKPVPGLAEKVPMGVAGPAAHRFIDLLGPYGMDLEYVSDIPGEAAARKLLRSILAKGMAAVVIDFLWAAESMGLQDWANEEVLREFDSSSATTAQRYLVGTAKHVKRRQIEMMDVTEMLNGVGYQSTMIDGVALTYSHILHSKKIPFSSE